MKSLAIALILALILQTVTASDKDTLAPNPFYFAPDGKAKIKYIPYEDGYLRLEWTGERFYMNYLAKNSNDDWGFEMGPPNGGGENGPPSFDPDPGKGGNLLALLFIGSGIFWGFVLYWIFGWKVFLMIGIYLFDVFVLYWVFRLIIWAIDKFKK